MQSAHVPTSPREPRPRGYDIRRLPRVDRLAFPGATSHLTLAPQSGFEAASASEWVFNAFLGGCAIGVRRAILEAAIRVVDRVRGSAALVLARGGPALQGDDRFAFFR